MKKGNNKNKKTNKIKGDQKNNKMNKPQSKKRRTEVEPQQIDNYIEKNNRIEIEQNKPWGQMDSNPFNGGRLTNNNYVVTEQTIV